MAKRSYPSNDFFKHRNGPKREARMGDDDWYVNSQGHTEAQNFFSTQRWRP